MCGFLCIIDFHQKIDDYTNNLNSISEHRGPDNQHSILGENFFFYFRRLSIIDLKNRSNQPYVSQKKQLYLVFNGEIYNFVELRNELKSLGYEFETTGDTEVLLKCYEEWQERCVEKLQGMFSFCIWDKKRNKFFAYRDRFGIKPLYYYKDGSRYIFSSEIKDILPFKKIQSENFSAVVKYLSRGFLDDSNETFYKDILSLEPGKFIEFSKDTFKIKRYWKLLQNDKRNFCESEFLDILKKTINLHLRSDVPIAFALSGGLDSNTITALSAKLILDKNNMKAFSIIPPHTVDETSWINDAISSYNIEHSYVNSTKLNSAEHFDKVLFYHDEPFHSSSIYYHYLLRQEIKKEKFKVLMVGEGADEVLAGYRRMIYPFIHDLEKNSYFDEMNKIFDESLEFMSITKKELLSNYKNFKTKLMKNLSDNESLNQNFLSKEILNNPIVNYRYNIEEYDKNKSTLKQSLTDHIFKRDLPYVLRMEDRNSMGNSIESRVPFLDHKLVEYIFSINCREFMKSGLNKYILRKSISDLLPASIINRKSKSARPGNDHYFMNEIVKEEFLDLLTSNSNLDNFVNIEHIRKNFLETDQSKKIESNNLEFKIFSYLKWRTIYSSNKNALN